MFFAQPSLFDDFDFTYNWKRLHFPVYRVDNAKDTQNRYDNPRQAQNADDSPTDIGDEDQYRRQYAICYSKNN